MWGDGREHREQRVKFLTGTVALVVTFGAMVGVQWARTRPAPLPEMFGERALGLSEAIESADQSGRVVLAVATASWCGPCQQYKRQGLADPAVAGWVAEHALPVMIDLDRNRDDAAALAPRAVPTTYVLRDGKVIATFEGPATGATLFAWLEESVREPGAGRLIPAFAHGDRVE